MPSSLWGRLLLRRLLWRAWRLKAVTTINIRVGEAHVASSIRAGTRVPFPRCLGSVPLGRITGVDVRVDIGLRERRRHADDHGQTTQATDQSELHQLSSFSTNNRHSDDLVALTSINSKRQARAPLIFRARRN